MDQQLFEIYRSKISDNGIALLRGLADNHLAGNSYAPMDQLPAVQAMSEEELQSIREVLLNLRITGGGDNRTDLITEEGLRFLHLYDNPPPKDYWAEKLKWFRSKRWSLPILVLTVVVPLLTSWLQIIEWIIRLWFGDASSTK